MNWLRAETERSWFLGRLDDEQCKGDDQVCLCQANWKNSFPCVLYAFLAQRTHEILHSHVGQLLLISSSFSISLILYFVNVLDPYYLIVVREPLQGGQ